MLTDAVAILAVAALCAGWVLLQRWIARLDPELPGIKRSCSGCTVPGSCSSRHHQGVQGRSSLPPVFRQPPSPPIVSGRPAARPPAR